MAADGDPSLLIRVTCLSPEVESASEGIGSVVGEESTAILYFLLRLCGLIIGDKFSVNESDSTGGTGSNNGTLSFGIRLGDKEK